MNVFPASLAADSSSARRAAHVNGNERVWWGPGARRGPQLLISGPFPLRGSKTPVRIHATFQQKGSVTSRRDSRFQMLHFSTLTHTYRNNININGESHDPSLLRAKTGDPHGGPRQRGRAGDCRSVRRSNVWKWKKTTRHRAAGRPYHRDKRRALSRHRASPRRASPEPQRVPAP